MSYVNHQINAENVKNSLSKNQKIKKANIKELHL